VLFVHAGTTRAVAALSRRSRAELSIVGYWTVIAVDTFVASNVNPQRAIDADLRAIALSASGHLGDLEALARKKGRSPGPVVPAALMTLIRPSVIEALKTRRLRRAAVDRVVSYIRTCAKCGAPRPPAYVLGRLVCSVIGDPAKSRHLHAMLKDFYGQAGMTGVSGEAEEIFVGVCSNAECANLSGPSDLELRTFACGGGRDAACSARYCSRECQAPH